MSDQSAAAVRYQQAVREMREAQQRKCEAVWEFLSAREALRETPDGATQTGRDVLPSGIALTREEDHLFRGSAA